LLEADLDWQSLVATHQTPVLKAADLSQLNVLDALQQYYEYAQQQLAAACDHETAASLALYGLGKIHLVLGGQGTTVSRLDAPKALVFHQAALLVDPANYRAANELGVLLARFGQLKQAREVLQQSVTVRPQPEAWHNLAVVHERLGESSLAQQARQELARLSSLSEAAKAPMNDAPVQWLEPQQFARISTGVEHDLRPPASAAPVIPPVSRPPILPSSARRNSQPPWLR
jgi:tetratricopeptide (TPR) repeat protein